MRFLLFISLASSLLLLSCSGGGGGDEENSFQAYDDAYQDYMSGEKSAEETLPEVESFVSAHPGEEVGYLFLAHLQVETGRLEDARSSYRSAIGINMKSYEAYNGLGYIFLNEMQYDSAISYMNMALEHNPKNPYSEANMAVCYLYKGDTAESIDLVNASLSKERNGHNTAVALLLSEKLPNREVADVELSEAETLNESFKTAAFKALEDGSGIQGWLQR